MAQAFKIFTRLLSVGVVDSYHICMDGLGSVQQAGGEGFGFADNNPHGYMLSCYTVIQAKRGRMFFLSLELACLIRRPLAAILEF